jgi:predicted amino acid-binding ACT domain protein
MFGKTKDDHDLPSLGHDEGVFGDEVEAARVAQLDEINDRVEQVEAQMRSQFTSMAAYAQIAQEQIDLARAEAKAEADRTEHRLTKLIERERADRIAAIGSASGNEALQAEVRVNAERLDALDAMVVEMSAALRDCIALQKHLAEAISEHFRTVAATPPAAEPTTEPEPVATVDAAPAASGHVDPAAPFMSPPKLTIPPLPSFDPPDASGELPAPVLRIPDLDEVEPIPGLSLAG